MLQDILADRFEMADRLNEIHRRIGNALWQLQELESVAASHFALVAQAKRGMGLEAGNALIENAQNKTFGVTVARLVKAGLVTPELQSRLDQLLRERNWLVHNSRATTRNAIHHDAAAIKLLDRLQRISDESLALLKEIALLHERFVKKHGVTEGQIREGAKRLLAEWHKADAT